MVGDFKNPLTLAFDLDDTICKGKPYTNSKPVNSMIKIVNDLYHDGHKIIIYTARGMGSIGFKEAVKQYWDLTVQQLLDWNVNYHELVFGKIHYDLIICDKAINQMQIHCAEDIYYVYHQIRSVKC